MASLRKPTMRICSIIAVLLILVSLVTPCFAAGASALTATEQMIALWAMYSESVGFSTQYSQNGVLNNTANPFSRSAAASNFEDLYSQYCTFSGRVETIEQTVNWIKANTEIAVSNQQTGAFQYAAGVTEFFDKFSTWVLEDVVGVVRDVTTGLFNQGQWFNNTLYVHEVGSLVQIPNLGRITASNRDIVIQNGLMIGQATNNGYYYFTSIWNNSYPVYAFLVNDKIYAASAATFDVSLVRSGASANLAQGYTWYDNNLFWYRFNDTLLFPSSALPRYESLDAFAAAFAGDAGTINRIQLRPKDEYNEGALGIPDVSSPDYVGTRVQEGVTSIPYDEVVGTTAADTLDNILTNVLGLTLANNTVLENSIPADPVVAPYVPIGIPDLNFNFSGIWHYVVSWVGSLRSGFSFISNIWSNIPYQIVIPIYGTAVAVIVIGTFRRFFA